MISFDLKRNQELLDKMEIKVRFKYRLDPNTQAVIRRIKSEINDEIIKKKYSANNREQIKALGLQQALEIIDRHLGDDSLYEIV